MPQLQRFQLCWGSRISNPRRTALEASVTKINREGPSHLIAAWRSRGNSFRSVPALERVLYCPHRQTTPKTQPFTPKATYLDGVPPLKPGGAPRNGRARLPCPTPRVRGGGAPVAEYASTPLGSVLLVLGGAGSLFRAPVPCYRLLRAFFAFSAANFVSTSLRRPWPGMRRAIFCAARQLKLLGISNSGRAAKRRVRVALK